MSSENSTKRKYTKRSGEFNDLTVEQVQQIKEDLKLELKKAENNLSKNPGDSILTQQVKELVGKRTRVYSRLRALGCNSKKIRSDNAAAKKQSS